MNIFVHESYKASLEYAFLPKDIDYNIYSLEVSGNILSFNNTEELKDSLIKMFIKNIERKITGKRITLFLQRRVPYPVSKVTLYKGVWKQIDFKSSEDVKLYEEVEFKMVDGIKLIGIADIKITKLYDTLHLLSRYYLDSFILIHDDISLEDSNYLELLLQYISRNSIKESIDFSKICKYAFDTDNHLIMWMNAGEEQAMNIFSKQK